MLNKFEEHKAFRSYYRKYSFRQGKKDYTKGTFKKYPDEKKYLQNKKNKSDKKESGVAFLKKLTKKVRHSMFLP